MHAKLKSRGLRFQRSECPVPHDRGAFRTDCSLSFASKSLVLGRAPTIEGKEILTIRVILRLAQVLPKTLNKYLSSHSLALVLFFLLLIIKEDHVPNSLCESLISTIY